MKILELGKFYPIRGGVEKVMYDLMTGVSAQGVRCDMLCTTGAPGPGFTQKINDNATLYVCRTLKKVSATTLSSELIRKMRKLKGEYDIVHVHHPDPMAALALMLSGYKGKVILHWHSDIIKQKTLLKFYKPIQDWLIKRADLIVGTTPLYVKESPFLQKVQDKVTYLPIGVNAMTPDPEKVSEYRANYPGKKLILSVGRCVPYKGFEYLIDAAALLPDDYHILIAGQGPLKEALQQKIDSMNLHDKVTMLGYVEDEDMPTIFGACDMYVLSSITKNEAFAIVQIEAMSCGKPIVATKIPESGVSWVNADGESGINVPVCDPSAIAEAVQTIMKPENYKDFCKRAQNRYHELFTKEKMVERCLEIYTGIAEK